MKLIPCKATLEVDFGKYYDNGKKTTLVCCQFDPHPGYNHYNPRLLLTCGGETVKAKGWSYWDLGKIVIPKRSEDEKTLDKFFGFRSS